MILDSVSSINVFPFSIEFRFLFFLRSFVLYIHRNIVKLKIFDVDENAYLMQRKIDQIKIKILLTLCLMCVCCFLQLSPSLFQLAAGNASQIFVFISLTCEQCNQRQMQTIYT